jgi:hypothetical protein
MFQVLRSFNRGSGVRGRVGDFGDLVDLIDPTQYLVGPSSGEQNPYVAAVAEYAKEAYTQAKSAVEGGDLDPKTACETSGIGMKYVPGVGCIPTTTPTEVVSRQLDCASRGMVYREYDANGNPVIAGCVPQGTPGAEPMVVLGGGNPVQVQGGGSSPAVRACIYTAADGTCWTVPCGGKFTRFNVAGSGGCECLPGYEWVDAKDPNNYDCKKVGSASPEGGKEKSGSYWPWLLGGAGVVAVGVAVAMSKKKRS